MFVVAVGLGGMLLLSFAFGIVFVVRILLRITCAIENFLPTTAKDIIRCMEAEHGNPYSSIKDESKEGVAIEHDGELLREERNFVKSFAVMNAANQV